MHKPRKEYETAVLRQLHVPLIAYRWTGRPNMRGLAGELSASDARCFQQVGFGKYGESGKNPTLTMRRLFQKKEKSKCV
jgi:hypothetical protein